MKIDFCQRLKSLKGLPMFEKSFESMVVSRVLKLAPEGQFKSWEELAMFLDESKVTFSEVLKEEGMPLCLKEVCVEALMLREVKGSGQLPGHENVIRYKLAVAIIDSKEPLSVKPSEVLLMQELLNKVPPTVMGPLLTGQSAELLEKGEPEESDALEDTRSPKKEIPSRRN